MLFFATIKGYYFVPSSSHLKLLYSSDFWVMVLAPLVIVRLFVSAYHSWILAYEAAEKEPVITPLAASYFDKNKAARKATKALAQQGWELAGTYVGKTNTTFRFLLFRNSAVEGLCLVCPTSFVTFVDFFVLEEGGRWIRVNNIPASMTYDEKDVRSIYLPSTGITAMEERFRRELRVVSGHRCMSEEPLDVFLRYTKDGNRSMRKSLLGSTAWQHMSNSLFKTMTLFTTVIRTGITLFYVGLTLLALFMMGFLVPGYPASLVEQSTEKKLKEMYASPKIRSRTKGLASKSLKFAHMTDPEGFMGNVVVTFEYLDRKQKRYVEFAVSLGDFPTLSRFEPDLVKLKKPRGRTYPKHSPWLFHMLVPLCLLGFVGLGLVEVFKLQRKRAELLSRARLEQD